MLWISRKESMASRCGPCCQNSPNWSDLDSLFLWLLAHQRSFSGLRRLKTYLHATMGQGRLNHLAVLNCHINITRSCSLDAIADEFITRTDSGEWLTQIFSFLSLTVSWRFHVSKVCFANGCNELHPSWHRTSIESWRQVTKNQRPFNVYFQHLLT